VILADRRHAGAKAPSFSLIPFRLRSVTSFPPAFPLYSLLSSLPPRSCLPFAPHLPFLLFNLSSSPPSLPQSLHVLISFPALPLRPPRPILPSSSCLQSACLYPFLPLVTYFYYIILFLSLLLLPTVPLVASFTPLHNLPCTSAPHSCTALGPRS